METIIAIVVLIVIGYIGYLVVRKWRKDLLEKIREKRKGR
jgi:hypothetical protein